MKKNTCEKTIDTFLDLDRGEHLGIQTTLHLLTCKKCRTVVRLCTIAQRSSSRPLYVPETMENNNISKIVQMANPTIELLKDRHIKPISMLRWVVSGCMLVSALLFFGLFNALSLQTHLQVTIYLCFSAFICIYCALFIGSNLDFFIKKIDKQYLSDL